jgi:lipoyl-dependent peroxiredoxin
MNGHTLILISDFMSAYPLRDLGIERTAKAVWEGTLKDGKGEFKTGSGRSGAFTYCSRFNAGRGTNPEELIGTAHASCFSMALAHCLSEEGYYPKRIETTARVHLEKLEEAFQITSIDLNTIAEIPGIDDNKFQEFAETAKRNCPVSKLVTGAEVHLLATLVS